MLMGASKIIRFQAGEKASINPLRAATQHQTVDPAKGAKKTTEELKISECSLTDTVPWRINTWIGGALVYSSLLLTANCFGASCLVLEVSLYKMSAFSQVQVQGSVGW